jgi:hypothetical protein
MVFAGRMAVRRSVLVAFIAAMVVGAQAQIQDDHELQFFDGPFEAVLLDGCVDDCRSFETLEEAEEHCNALGYECGGITKTAYGDQDAISLGVGLYEVRSGPGIEQQEGDMTWIKQDGCAEQGGSWLGQNDYYGAQDDGRCVSIPLARMNYDPKATNFL